MKKTVEKKKIVMLAICGIVWAFVFVQSYAKKMPTILISPDNGSIIAEGQYIEIMASANGGIDKIWYKFDGQEFRKCGFHNLNIEAPSAGKHTLRVIAISKPFYFSYKEIELEVLGIDTSAPTVSVTPCSGTIREGSSIQLYSRDPSGIKEIKHIWDSGKEISSKDSDQPFKDTATVPESKGTHTLYVCSRDNSALNNETGWKIYTYTVGGD